VRYKCRHKKRLVKRLETLQGAHKKLWVTLANRYITMEDRSDKVRETALWHAQRCINLGDRLRRVRAL